MTDRQLKKQVIRDKQTSLYRAAVIGGGPAGMLAALELSRVLGENSRILLAGPVNKGQETRTTALMMPSVDFIRRLNIWPQLTAEAAPLRTMRIIDGTKRLIRSPTVEFHAAELGLAAFGYNMANKALNAALSAEVERRANIERRESAAEHYELETDKVSIRFADGSMAAAELVAAADGRASKARAAAGIEVRRWSYPQTALTLTFRHEVPHNNISTEFHTEHGPFTQVPLIGNRSALVWTMAPEKARALQALGLRALSEAIGEQMHYMLGKVEAENLPEGWPMGGLMAKKFAARRVALLGETAHAFPPIGAQGLNLTIRDARDLGEAVAASPADCGAEAVMRVYNSHRMPDVLLRTGCVHGLNRALLSDFLPVQFLRSGGLELLRRHALLRDLFMREGMAPGAGFKKLLSLPAFLKR